jgi:non-hemolytic enterotoxin B/C
MSDLSGQVPVAGQNTGSAIIQLNVLAKAVVDQPQFPVIDVPGLQNINDHLATAQTHANDWLNMYSGQVWNRLQGIISTGEIFNNLYAPLYQAAQNMGNETQFQPNEIQKVVGALQALQSLVQSQYKQTQDTYTAVTTYRTSVSADHSQFMTDYNTANTALGGASGEIAQLQAKISSEQDAMNKDLSMIAGGAAMMVVGLLMIAVGALAEIETAGVSTAIVVAGIAVVAGGASMTGVAGKNYDDTMNNLKTDQTTLANDQAEIALLNGLKGQFDGLNNTLGTAEEALNNLVTAWQQLGNSINAVITDLQSPEDYLTTLKQTTPDATPSTVSLIISAELQTANQDWSSAVTLAQAYLTKGRNIEYVSTGQQSPTQQAIAQAGTQSTNMLARPRPRLRLAA